MDTPTFVLSAVACGKGLACPDSQGCKYSIAWSINPHMRVGASDFGRAAVQHEALKRALAREGAELVELPFVHGAFDSVFAKDPALLLERGGRRRALLASQRHHERRAEQAARARCYESLGYEVVAAPDVHWEGGDVVRFPSGARFLLGHGPRSDARAAAWLEEQLGVPVVGLELCDPHFFHLDMALSVLPDDTVLVCDEALTPASRARLRGLSGVREVVSISRDDALLFGLNLVAVRDAILCGAHVPGVQAILRARGYRPVVVPLDEFHLAGGSVACLTTRVHQA